ncbi:hypothetical protein CLF_100142 [Clonorchis sinensis]|uniref:Uncharacterized protein n=1 Tax=Clonorchis sinensis TaxID=79923 RepID=G7Y2S2_CLOSI|nr:hypothetical protein CLF_100142 [Clonorchis sinensis]
MQSCWLEFEPIRIGQFKPGAFHPAAKILARPCGKFSDHSIHEHKYRQLSLSKTRSPQANVSSKKPYLPLMMTARLVQMSTRLQAYSTLFRSDERRGRNQHATYTLLAHAECITSFPKYSVKGQFKRCFCSSTNLVHFTSFYPYNLPDDKWADGVSVLHIPTRLSSLPKKPDTYSLFEQVPAHSFLPLTLTISSGDAAKGFPRLVHALSLDNSSSRVVDAWNNLPPIVAHAASRTQFSSFIWLFAPTSLLPKANNFRSDTIRFFCLSLPQSDRKTRTCHQTYIIQSKIPWFLILRNKKDEVHHFIFQVHQFTFCTRVQVCCRNFRAGANWVNKDLDVRSACDNSEDCKGTVIFKALGAIRFSTAIASVRQAQVLMHSARYDKTCAAFSINFIKHQALRKQRSEIRRGIAVANNQLRQYSVTNCQLLSRDQGNQRSGTSKLIQYPAASPKHRKALPKASLRSCFIGPIFIFFSLAETLIPSFRVYKTTQPLFDIRIRKNTVHVDVSWPDNAEETMRKPEPVSAKNTLHRLLVHSKYENLCSSSNDQESASRVRPANLV